MAVRIPDEKVNQIRTETNIVDIVSQYVQLKKRGKNYFGFCPFHDEKTPSFSVTDEKQIFHCFSCGRGGNVFKFLMEVDGIGFVEAVSKVADISDIPLGVDLSINQPRSPLQTKKDQLIEIHEQAAAYYHQILMNTVTGEEALAYLERRGFTVDILEEFQIGFSPSNKTTTQQILARENFSNELLRESGIFSDRDDPNEFLDRFSSRIIFPLRNERGKVIAFSGRVLPGKENEQNDSNFHEAKYLNSPETIIFSKRNFLFNLDKSRKEMRKTSEVILFEGYMDVISAWQAGINNGVASMGTALADEQIRILNKLVDSVVIAYDGDRAGVEATQKAVSLLDQGNRFDISIFPLPPGMDPDDYIQEKGTEAFQHAITNQRESVFQFHSRYMKSQLDLSSEKNQSQYLEEMIRLLVKVDSIIERELYLNELAEEFDVSPDVLKTRLQEYQKSHLISQRKEKRVIQQPVFTIEPPTKRKESLVEISERQLLYRLFHYEEAWTYLRELAPDFSFTDEAYQTIYLLYDGFRDQIGSVGHINQFLDQVTDPHLANKVSSIEMLDLQADLSEQEIEDLVRVNVRTILEIKLKQNQTDMVTAKRENNREQGMHLLQSVIQLKRELEQLKK